MCLQFNSRKAFGVWLKPFIIIIQILGSYIMSSSSTSFGNQNDLSCLLDKNNVTDSKVWIETAYSTHMESI